MSMSDRAQILAHRLGCKRRVSGRYLVKRREGFHSLLSSIEMNQSHTFLCTLCKGDIFEEDGRSMFRGFKSPNGRLAYSRALLDF